MRCALRGTAYPDNLGATSDTITGGAPFLQVLRDGSFDGCEIERGRVFFSDRIGGTAIGDVTLFKGRLGTVDQIGPTSAKLTVNSDLVLLNIDMPRNLYQSTCLHTLYDSGCTLVKNAFGTNGTVGAGSTASIINWSGTDHGVPAGFDHLHLRCQHGCYGECEHGRGGRVADAGLADGSIHAAEVHWYETAGLGRKEFEIKRLL